MSVGRLKIASLFESTIMVVVFWLESILGEGWSMWVSVVQSAIQEGLSGVLSMVQALTAVMANGGA